MADELDTQEPLVDELADFANTFLNDVEPADPTPAPEPEVKPDPEPEPEVKPDPEPEPEVKPDPEPEVKPDPDQEPEHPSNKDHWNNLRASRDRHKAAAEEKDAFLKEKDAQIEELKSKAARAAELEEKLKVFDEQERELAIARVEATREYKDNIEKPLQAIGTQAEALAQSNEGDVGAVFRMLNEADPVKQRTMLKELTAGWDEIDRLDMKKMADDARTLLDKQDAMRTNAHAAAKEREEIASRTAAAEKEAVRKEFTNATADVVKSLREKMPFTPLVEGETEDDRYNLLAQKVQAVDFDNQTPRAKALAAASALALPKAIETIAAKDKEIAELKAALAKESKSKPTVSPKAETKPAEPEKDFFEEFGIREPAAMFGSHGLDVRGE